MSADLKLIAEERWQEPLNTWPDHTDLHRYTLSKSRIFDDECLRCWLELVASDALKERQKQRHGNQQQDRPDRAEGSAGGDSPELGRPG